MKPTARFAIAAGVVVAAIGGLIAWSLTGTTAYYRTPSELATGATDPEQRVRVAGKVLDGSVQREGETTNFMVTDGSANIAVTTRDILPDTFDSGVEVVAEGSMTSKGIFSASTVLAKCPSKFKAKAQSSQP